MCSLLSVDVIGQHSIQMLKKKRASVQTTGHGEPAYMS
jgi:hypothetical protein